MKKILSISVGSASRDHTTRSEFLGQQVELSRQGTSGDLTRAVKLYKHFDGKVDALLNVHVLVVIAAQDVVHNLNFEIEIPIGRKMGTVKCGLWSSVDDFFNDIRNFLHFR